MFKNLSAKYSTLVRVSKEEPVFPTQTPPKQAVKAKSMYAAETSHKSDDAMWQEWCGGHMPIQYKTSEPKAMLDCMNPSSEEEQNALYEWCTGMRLSNDSRDSRMSFSSCDSNY